MSRRLRRALTSAVPLTLLLGACDRLPTRPEDQDPVGTWTLVALGTDCDYSTQPGIILEGGKFSAGNVEGSMTFHDDGSVTHDFSLTGTCTLPDGSEVRVDGAWSDQGSWEVTSGRSVHMTHHDISCTGTLDGDALSVRTGTLFPALRFTYELRRDG